MISRIGRRAFARSLVGLVLSSGAFCVVSRVEAQRSAPPWHIGVLVVSFSPESKEAQAFRQGLRDAGYAEGRDVVIEWRVAQGDYDRVPGFVDDLVQKKVDVIVVDTTLAAQRAKRTTSTIPIVLAFVADPVASGLVPSLAHPGGNVTGLSMMITDLSTKQLQLLKELEPRLGRVAVLWNPVSPFHARVIEDLKATAPPLGIELTMISAQTPGEISSAIAAGTRAHAQALYVIVDPMISTNRTTLIDVVAKARIPAVYPERRFADDGGLISYGPNLSDLFRRSAGYVDKILKGAKPGDLPIEQPIKFDCIINLRTAKALGLAMPQSVLLQATEVIR